MRLRITGRLPALRLSPRGGTGCACLRREFRELDEVNQREESMTTLKAMRLASVVTAINVLVATGFSVVGIVRPQYLVPVESVPTQASLILALYAAARTIPSGFVRIGGDLQASDVCIAALRCARRRRCNCRMPESVCLSVIPGNALGRSLSLSSNLRGVSGFTNPCGSPRKPSANRLSRHGVPVAPVCRREFREPCKQFGLTGGQEQENIYEKRQGTDA